jgi:hypothetical protein
MMKKLLGLAVLVLAAGLASPALADHRSAAPASTSVERGAGFEVPTTEVTGRVVDIDREHGALMLQTTEGYLALQGPPEALRDVNVGDMVRVRVALREESPLPSLSEELDRTEQARR